MMYHCKRRQRRRRRLGRGPIWRSTTVDGGNPAARFGAPQRWRGGPRPAPTKFGGSPRL
uniref:Uncharacterized protein n=1 Tax=Arundo donax TaxID=35708 RepID=A0A0A9F7K5_ARUDO